MKRSECMYQSWSNRTNLVKSLENKGYGKHFTSEKRCVMENKTILLVDDEQNLLDAMSRLFRKTDFTLLTAKGGEAGLKLLETNEIQLVISDYNMPLMTGIEFLSIVRRMYPNVVRVILTGQSDLSVGVDAINKGEIYRYLNKPVNKEEFFIVINQCFEHNKMIRENQELTLKTLMQNEELGRLNAKLAELNAIQSKSLELSQEILERLPVAVIGITANREIALTNNAAKKIISSLNQVLPGTDISDVLPDDLQQAVNSSMADGTPLDSTRFIWNRTLIRATLEPLNENGISRGCIITFDTQEFA